MLGVRARVPLLLVWRSTLRTPIEYLSFVSYCRLNNISDWLLD